MKKLNFAVFFLFFFGLFFSANLYAQEPSSEEQAKVVEGAEKNTKAAKIKFEVKTHAFGDIFQGDVVKHTFTFKNEGEAPLVLTNVATTCGCTAPEWTREPVMPGEDGKVVVSFNSAGKMGKQDKVITIFSNASNAQERINITTNILPKKK